MSDLASALARHADLDEARIAVSDAGSSLTRAELVAWVAGAAEDLGAAPETMGILGANGVEWAVAFLAASIAGKTIVPVPAFFSKEQRAHLIRDAGTVDKILAVNVVYFFQESAQEIREAKRALRPGGVMAIYATDKSTMSRWQFSRSDTHSHFDQDDLRVFVMRGDFSADEVSVRSLTLAFGVKGLLAILRKGQDSAPYCKE